MNLKMWYELNIDISNALNEKLDLDVLYQESQFYGRNLVVFFYDSSRIHKVFSPEWMQYMHSLGIPVKSCIIFRREPNYLCDHAHIDQFFDKMPAIYAINWVVNPKDNSEMIWYDVPESVPCKDDVYNDTTAKNDNRFRDLSSNSSTNFRSWLTKDVQPYEFARTCIGHKPTLVNTGVAHNIQTYDQQRWAISVRIKYHDGIVLDNWQQVVDFYQPLIKN